MEKTMLNFNSLLSAVVLLAVGSVWKKTSDNNDTLVVVSTQLPYVTQSVTELKTQIAQLVTRSEMESRFGEFNAKIAVLDKRLMQLEFEKKSAPAALPYVP